MINEPLPISKDFPIKARFYDYKHFTYPWHFHSQFEIIYVREGYGTRFVGTNINRFESGDIIILGPNLPHYLKSDDEYMLDDNDLRVKGTIIQFEMDFMNYSINNYPHFSKIKRLLDDSVYGILIKNTPERKIEELLNEIPLKQGIEQLLNLVLLLKEIADLENKSLLSNSISKYEQHAPTSRIEKVLSYLNRNYTRNISLDEIASLSSMNAAAFCRFFKMKTGKSFKNYILDMRIAYACKLLSLNRNSILQISSECGFDTISHFNQTFKKNIGYTPTQYKAFMSQE